MSYTGNNPMILKSYIRSETNTGFLATGYRPLITGVIDSGSNADLDIWENHLGREYFRRLYNEGLSEYITDEFDVGFRPISISGLYASINQTPEIVLNAFARYLD